MSLLYTLSSGANLQNFISNFTGSDNFDSNVYTMFFAPINSRTTFLCFVGQQYRNIDLGRTVRAVPRRLIKRALERDYTDDFPATQMDADSVDDQS